jgi:hypothetical protein
MSTNIEVVYDTLTSWAASFELIPEVSITFIPDLGMKISVHWNVDGVHVHDQYCISKQYMENEDAHYMKWLEKFILERFEKNFRQWEVGEE